MLESLSLSIVIMLAVVAIGFIAIVIKMYQKAIQGEALVRTGLGDTKVSFSGIFVVPVIHKLEVMDITLKTIVISRTGSEGLICKDNLRADIKVNFFLRVNKTPRGRGAGGTVHRLQARLRPLLPSKVSSMPSSRKR